MYHSDTELPARELNPIQDWYLHQIRHRPRQIKSMTPSTDIETRYSETTLVLTPFSDFKATAAHS